MSRSRHERIDKLERVLRLVWARREAPPPPPHWMESVMADVRRQSRMPRTVMEVPRLIWRAAAVVVVVSTLFVGSVLSWNTGSADADAAFSALFAEAGVDETLLTGEP